MNSLDRQAMERNLKLYPWYHATVGVMPWLPIFFLYFLQYVPLEQAVRLGAIYYLAVVFAEVPSGYLSDRYGRRLIMLLSGCSLLVAYLAFISAVGFYGLLVGEIFLAVGIAFLSGSDTSLLYDSLVSLERQPEYAEREARAQQFTMAASALACVLGGLSGAFNLVLPYIMSVAAVLVSLTLCSFFTEPPTQGGKTTQGFGRQLLTCVQYLRQKVLLWLLCFYMAGYALQHVPYEFYQPYIKLLPLDFTGLFDNLDARFDSAPLVSGLVFGCSMAIGVVGARVSMRFFQYLGLTRLLAIAIALQTLVIGAMGLVLSPLVLLLVIGRNFSMSMVRGPFLGAVSPRLQSAHRATYLSLQSLMARLGFSLALFLLSLSLSPQQSLDWPSLSWLFQACAAVGLACLAALLISARKLGIDAANPPPAKRQ